ncbi:Pycsar system effector family protein [Streptomyces sp. NPDC088812]|uniref:Pycsar system effector family protein n=1 Tax=Streptomyces sp. NPDC088812 TaxID=3365905 RepID=UPI00382466A7
MSDSSGNSPSTASPVFAQASTVETAWRIYTALADWTGKVDTKAAFALTVESAALALTAVLRSSSHSGPGGAPRLDGLSAPALATVGMGLLTVAALLAVLAVVPRLGDEGVPRSGPGFVYFGDLRGLAPDELAQTLRTTDPLPVLSRQLVIMSKIAWRKHRCTQASLALAAAGLVTAALAAAAAG